MKCIVVLGMVMVIMMMMSGKREAMSCNPVEFSACLGSITSSSPPSTTCCQKAREQRPCLCGYLKNPNLRQYFYTPGARRVVNACGVPFSSC
ncbi:hypothetical protein VNO78_34137 [Psophocarpus tetragonolobus]|uniref:Bifunctional inhibitor/plant lipid transfer protein/seed storage helical domain-containing protein n=1 Tax=Psophocarpus tetragonolobus TaxID=3891 RepID=A0AAN9NZA0_PSOTE